MQYGAITGYMDVAQLTLYGFWIFFAGLVFYLRVEDKREGFPMISEKTGKLEVEGFPPIPKPKFFRLLHGTNQTAPRKEIIEPLNARPLAPWAGAPLAPIGDPLRSGMGPGAWCERAEVPDVTFDDALPKIVPLRVAKEFFLASEDPDPRGMSLVGADGKVAGTIKDAWVDRSEVILRYLEADLLVAGAPRSVLVPMNLLQIDARRRRVTVASLRAAQFALVPALSNPDQVTLREEDRILAFYGGGQLYADQTRAEPLL